MQIELYKNVYARIVFNYDPGIVQLVRSLPGAQYEPKSKAWLLPIDHRLERSVGFLVGKGFKLDIQFLGIFRFWKDREKIRTALKADVKMHKISVGDSKDELPLYNFQMRLVQQMNVMIRFVNTAFTGSGKTLQTIAWIGSQGIQNFYPNSMHVLIVVPKSVRIQWQEEMGNFMSGAQVTRVNGAPKARELAYETFTKADRYPNVLLTTYELLRQDIERVQKLKFDVLVCDEAHRLVNPSAQVYKAVKAINVPLRGFLTATPIMNRALDVYGLYNLVCPGLFGSYKSFIDTYTIRNEYNSVVGYRNIDQLQQIIEPWTVGITLEEAGIELPPVTETDIPFKLSPKEQNFYTKVQKEALAELTQEEISKLSEANLMNLAQTKMVRLQQIASYAGALGDITECSKLDTLKELLADKVSHGTKAVIFTQFSTVAEMLHRELPESYLITGQTDTDTRGEIVKNFTKNPTPNILIGTSAISAGLNLQTANIIINYDLPWSVGQITQRIGRAHRIGQEKPVFVYNLLAQGTADYYVKRTLEAKELLADQVKAVTYADFKREVFES